MKLVRSIVYKSLVYRLDILSFEQYLSLPNLVSIAAVAPYNVYVQYCRFKKQSKIDFKSYLQFYIYISTDVCVHLCVSFCTQNIFETSNMVMIFD